MRLPAAAALGKADTVNVLPAKPLTVDQCVDPLSNNKPTISLFAIVETVVTVKDVAPAIALEFKKVSYENETYLWVAGPVLVSRI